MPLPHLRPKLLRPAANPALDKPSASSSNVSAVVYQRGIKILDTDNYKEALELVNLYQDAYLWLDVCNPSISFMADLSRDFSLHPLLVEDILESHGQPKLERYDETLFLVLKTLRYVSHPAGEFQNIDESIITSEIMIINGVNFIITFRQPKNSLDINFLRHTLEKNGPERINHGPLIVMHSIADTVVDSYVEVVNKFNIDIENAEEKIFSSTGTTSVEYAYLLKREILQVKRAITPLAGPFSLLTGTTYPSITKEIRRYFRDVKDHYNTAIDEINAFDEVLDSLVDAAVARVTIQQNTDMRKISAWAAILSLPTMVAGIYGMNFDDMPELHWRFGYYIVLGLMIGFCFLLWRSFRKNKWL